MANILSQERRNQLKRDYVFRIVSVGLFLMSISLFVGALLLSPALIMAQSYFAVMEEEYETTLRHEEGTEYQNIKKTITKTNLMIDAVQKIPQEKLTSFIGKVFSLQKDFFNGVSIKSIYFGSGNKTMHVTGTVTSRDVLTRFVQQLKQDDDFKNVKVPLSDFAKSSKMTFSVLITI